MSSIYKDAVSSIARNTSVMVAQQVITNIIALLLMLVLPRYLGPVQYGRLFFGISFTYIFIIVVQYGGTYLVAKEVSRSPERTGQVVVDAMASRFILGVLSILVVVAIAVVASYPPEIKWIMLGFAIWYLWEGSSIVLFGAFQGRELMRYNSLTIILDRSFLLIGILVSVWMESGVLQIVGIYVASSLFRFLMLFGFLRKIVERFPPINWNEVLRQTKEGLPYFLFTVFGAIYYKIDTIMLSKMAPEEVLGWYGGAYRLFEALNFPYLLTTAMYPVLSRLWQDDRGTHDRTITRSLEMVIVMSIFVTLSVVSFARPVIALFYGIDAYGESVILLQVLSFALPFLFVDMVLGTVMLASDRQKQFVWISFFMILLNGGLNIFLIPYFQANYQNGAMGAAVAKVATEICITISLMTILRKIVLPAFRLGVVAKGIASGAAMLGAILGLGALPISIPWPVQAVVGAGIYFSGVLLLKTFDRTEVDYLKDAARKAIRKVVDRLPGRKPLETEPIHHASGADSEKP